MGEPFPPYLEIVRKRMAARQRPLPSAIWFLERLLARQGYSRRERAKLLRPLMQSDKSREENRDE